MVLLADPNQEAAGVKSRTPHLPAILSPRYAGTAALRSHDASANAVQTALNAAALQTLHKAVPTKLYTQPARGTVVWAKRERESPRLEDRLADVSYIADRQGHGLNPPQTQLPARVEAGHDHTVVPPGRADAIKAAARLQQALNRLGEKPELDAELAAWDAAFVDCTRQVFVHCAERGQLLESIRLRHGNLFTRLVRERERELSALRDEHAAALSKETRAACQKTTTVLAFHKAVADAELKRSTDLLVDDGCCCRGESGIRG